MRKTVLISLALLGLSACASLEPEPCSAEWIEWRTSRVLDQFTATNAADLRELRSFSSTLSEGELGPLTALRIPAMIETFKDVAIAFRDEALPELNAAMDQCGNPQEWIPAFTELLEDQGLDDTILDWVELLGALVVDN